MEEYRKISCKRNYNGNITYDRDFYYGFKNIEQFKAWVYDEDWIKGLNEKNVALAVIESDYALYGSTQAVFNAKHEYTVLDELDILTI